MCLTLETKWNYTFVLSLLDDQNLIIEKRNEYVKNTYIVFAGGVHATFPYGSITLQFVSFSSL